MINHGEEDERFWEDASHRDTYSPLAGGATELGVVSPGTPESHDCVYNNTDISGTRGADRGRATSIHI